MEKGCRIAFLLAVFFIAAFSYAGNTFRCQVQNRGSSSCLKISSRAKEVTHHQPVLLAIHDFCNSIAGNSTNNLQKIISYHPLHAARVNDALSGVHPTASRVNFFHQKMYLFYIYPSHHFW